MGTYVNEGKVILGDTYNYSNATKEIANLIAVGNRSDGRLYLSDICVGENIKMWAKYKPEEINSPINITLSERRMNGFGIAINMFNHLNSQKPLQYIDSINYIKPSSYKRIRDFDGYNHNAKNPFEWKAPEYKNGDQWLIPYLKNQDPDSFPIEKTILQTMVYNGNSTNNIISIDSIGRLFVTYSGFFRDDVTLSYDDINSLIQDLQNNSSGSNFRLNSPKGLGVEPKGRYGDFIFYAKKGDSYIQILPSIRCINPGNIHPIIINGWTPNMVLRSLYNDINTSFVVKNLINNNSILKFCEDDVLFFNFSIQNKSTTQESSNSIKLKVTVNIEGNSTNYSMFFDLHDAEEPLNSLKVWTINPNETKTSFIHDRLYGFEGTYFPRFCIAPYAIINALKKVPLIIPVATVLNVNFSLLYEQNNSPLFPGGNLEEGYLSSNFSIRMQWVEGEVSSKPNIPNFVKPEIPDLDIKIT